MSPAMRQLISFFVVVMCLILAGFVFARGGNPSVGVGGVMGVVAVLIVNARAHRQRS
jgi:hypothetical protein